MIYGTVIFCNYKYWSCCSSLYNHYASVFDKSETPENNLAHVSLQKIKANI